MRSLLVIVCLLIAPSPANAGLVFFDFRADNTSSTGVASAQGVVDTVANTFTLTQITMPTVFAMRTPTTPLVFEAISGVTLLSWDVPDSATAQDIINEINTGTKGFLLPGRNNNHAWTPANPLFNATAGWGVGVQNRGFGQLTQFTSARRFQRFPQVANGTAIVDWTVNSGSGVSEVTAVPEPSSMALVGVAVAAGLFIRARRK